PTVNAVFFSQLTAGGRFGQTLAAGDFNGDGFKDLAIAAPGQNRVFIMLGSLGPTQQLVGNGGQFGAAMTVGDFNHDGKDDLVVGSPGEFRTALTGNVAAGAVRVYFGGSGGLSLSPQVIDQGSLPATDAGKEESGDQFGAALAAGELNGDLIDDLAIGVAGEDINGVINAGMVHIIPGRSLQTLNLAAGLGCDGRNFPSPYT